MERATPVNRPFVTKRILCAVCTVGYRAKTKTGWMKFAPTVAESVKFVATGADIGENTAEGARGRGAWQETAALIFFVPFSLM